VSAAGLFMIAALISVPPSFTPRAVETTAVSNDAAAVATAKQDPAQPSTIPPLACPPLAWMCLGALVALPIAQASLSALADTTASMARPPEGRAGGTQSSAATLASLTSLAAPIGLFVATAHLDVARRLVVVRAVLMFVACAALMGFFQVLQGPESPLRLFEITNPSEAVGPFANRNHFATLLVVAIALSQPLLYRTIRRFDGWRSLAAAPGLGAFASFAFILTLLVAVALARSRAGLILGLVAVVCVLTILVVSTRQPRRRSDARHPRPWLWISLVALSALAIAIELGIGRIGTRFAQDPLEDLRVPFAQTTMELVWYNLPLGSGLGTFVAAYQQAERPDALLTAYANRAHNDWLEFLLEGGIWAAGILIAFLTWYGARLVQLASRHHNVELWLVHVAGALGVAIICLHSVVDYPLRTSAMAAIFAVCCGLMTRTPTTCAGPRQLTGEPERSSDKPVRTSRPAPVTPTRPAEPIAPTEWPEAWQRKG